jgi:uncharacterized protein (DUF58 family)
MSGKTFLFLTLATGLILAGIIERNGSLILLAFFLLLWVAFAWIRRPKNLQLKVSRRLSHGLVSVGSPVEVSLRIENEGSDLDELLVEDYLPEQVQVVENQAHILTPLRKGQAIEFTYIITSQRGSLGFPMVRASASDTFGFFTTTLNFPTSGRLTVIPRPTRIREPIIHPERTMGFAGPIRARQAGAGTDFFGLREYQLGDPRRHINWRVSARHEAELYTNEFEQERIAQVGFILDAREQSNPVFGKESIFEFSVQMTAALAEAFLRQGNRVGLLVYGHTMLRTFPGYGKVQLERILRSLAEAVPGHNYALEKLDYLPTRFFPAHSQIVLVSPLMESDYSVLTRLRALGYSVMLVSPDPVYFEAMAVGLDLNNDPAARIARLERHLMLTKLQRAGIQVVNWPVEQPLQAIIDRTLRRKQPEVQRIVSSI